MGRPDGLVNHLCLVIYNSTVAVGHHAVVQAGNHLAASFLKQEREKTVQQTGNTCNQHFKPEGEGVRHVRKIAFTDCFRVMCE